MNSDYGFVVLLAGFFVFALLCAFVLGPAMASEGRARNAAANLGLSDVRVESKSAAFGTLSGCSQHDNVQFRVSGTTAAGQRRYVKVCATVPLGGYTVRT